MDRLNEIKRPLLGTAAFAGFLLAGVGLLLAALNGFTFASRLLLCLGGVTCFIGLAFALRLSLPANNAPYITTTLTLFALFALTFSASIFSGGPGTVSHGVLTTAGRALLSAGFSSAVTACFARTRRAVLLLPIAAAAAATAVPLALGFTAAGEAVVAALAAACIVSFIFGRRSPARPLPRAAACVGVLTLALTLYEFTSPTDTCAGMLGAIVGLDIAVAHYAISDCAPAEAKKRTAKKIPARPAARAALSAEESARRAVTAQYRGKSFAEIADAPLTALSGMTQEGADELRHAFGITSVRELAENKYFAIASLLSSDEHTDKTKDE